MPPEPGTTPPPPFPQSQGIKYTDLEAGGGEAPKVGDLVMCDLVLSLEDGSKVLDTRETGTPIAFQVGITNPRERGTIAGAMLWCVRRARACCQQMTR
jgi:FKBP-type peptidyl-prolyl cis-trans isomerase